MNAYLNSDGDDASESPRLDPNRAWDIVVIDTASRLHRVALSRLAQGRIDDAQRIESQAAQILRTHAADAALLRDVEAVLQRIEHRP